MQRALGYSYETEKAFQTGVKLTVTETIPPDAALLKFMLARLWLRTDTNGIMSALCSEWVPFSWESPP
jgi:hypothetical protein